MTPRSESPQPTRGRVRQWLGLVVAVLLLEHVLYGYVLDGGVSRLDWNLMAARWASSFGLVWDLALVWITGGYAALLLWERRRAGRSGPAFAATCSVAVLAIAVFATVAILTTNTSLA